MRNMLNIIVTILYITLLIIIRTKLYPWIIPDLGTCLEQISMVLKMFELLMDEIL